MSLAETIQESKFDEMETKSRIVEKVGDDGMSFQDLYQELEVSRSELKRYLKDLVMEGAIEKKDQDEEKSEGAVEKFKKKVMSVSKSSKSEKEGDRRKESEEYESDNSKSNEVRPGTDDWKDVINSRNTEDIS